MLKCPKCGKEMIWVGDNDNGEETWTEYTCNDCRVDVVEWWDEI